MVLHYTLTIMPKFVIEREIPGAGKMSESELRQVSLRSLQVLKEMGPRFSGSTVTSPKTRSTAFTSRQTRTAFGSTPAGQAFQPTVLPQYAA